MITDNGNNDSTGTDASTDTGASNSSSGFSERARRLAAVRASDEGRSDGSEAGANGDTNGSDGSGGGNGGQQSGSRDGHSDNGTDSFTIGGSGIGSGGSSSGQPGKRGRHARECACERCQARRDNRSTVPITDEPKRVAFDQLSGAKVTNAKEIEKEAVSIALNVLFEAPKYIYPAGTAEHWPLTAPEEKDLQKRIADVLAMLPKRKKTAAMKFLEKVMPPVALMVTGYMVTAPRILLSNQLVNELKRRNASNASQTPTNGTGSASGSSAAASDLAEHVDRPSDGINDTDGGASGRAVRDPFAASPPFGFGLS